MHFSCKIKKFYDGMQIYENLLEDEKAMHVPFAMSFIVTITTIVGQLKQFLIDLKNKVCQEIPDIDYVLMGDINNIMSPKFERDMMSYGKKWTLRLYLEENYGDYLDMTFPEIHRYIYDNAVSMTGMINVAHRELKHTDTILYERYVCKHIKDGNWDDVREYYQKCKGNHSRFTLEMLMEMQEQELEKYLNKGIMRFAKKPSGNQMKRVDYDFHTDLLDCDFTDTKDYKKAYTQFMYYYATRKDGMIIVDLKEYGKYIFDNYYQFTENQKVAVFEVIVILSLIQRDMLEWKPEMVKYLGGSNGSMDSLEDTIFFAPYLQIKKMLTEAWFKKQRADDKYNEKWADGFSEGLMKSDFGLQIAKDWKDNGNQIKGYVIGCLKEAGVFKENVSNDSLARDAGIMSNTRTFGKYIGKESLEQPYAEWIKEHVNDYC